ncbi:hypothetical protein BX616_008037 [Lobosporangium transversale]|uniref:Uncharacterized protein n=1 Tax=Lobosporangium transversale TaxID=64571 RepID=A0A1Y2GX45_9FUNG|nr:hypothetical protein BCR41DRAFT_350227 [Lobosporangium transversale]XP_021883169.1 hypothetical protein BCR41DRAFT_420825 [Lobosporangium transversale]KAF9896152.1 hypothetical protein BX616_008037 [Lobosporangium transversale]ORZ21917.1 hypothetical protein BCR41DRAFT_350227 [Lobosporangium transversale]ORZ21918.1 hypothetical protein BCR41DRAFT_420825 [Lobosporangium transversale]|eukprot:XP_021883168.1 hypothetical protein BCR41DRAFT_350227 [Lobosporangium transversale]
MPKAITKKFKAVTLNTLPPPYDDKESLSSPTPTSAIVYIKPLIPNKLCIAYTTTPTKTGTFKPPGEECSEVGHVRFPRHVHRCHACQTMILDIFTEKKKCPKNATIVALPDNRSRHHHYLDPTPVVISAEFFSPPDPSKAFSPSPDPGKYGSEADGGTIASRLRSLEENVSELKSTLDKMDKMQSTILSELKKMNAPEAKHG